MNYAKWLVTIGAAAIAISLVVAIDGCARSSGTTGSSAQTGINAIALGAATNPSAVEYASAADAGTAQVLGTSTLHDWTVTSTSIAGHAGFSSPLAGDKASSSALESIDLTIPVNSLKSTEGSGMDNTMYDALKMSQFASITYKLTSATLKSGPAAQDPSYHFDATGDLTVSGSTHAINLDLAIVPRGAGALTITTQIDLNMTDFSVTPPTAMLGMVKSGNKITVKVNWQLAPQAPAAPVAKAGK